MKSLLYFLGIFTFFTFLFSCSLEISRMEMREDQNQYRMTILPRYNSNTINIRVIDSKNLLPIPDADLIFSFNNSNEIIKTDINGEGEFLSSIIDSDAFSLTVKASGYTLLTLYNLENKQYDIFLPLKKIVDDSQKVKVKGTLEKFHKIKSNDGIFDFGLFLPFLSLDKIFSLDPSVFLSPTITVDIFGDREIPGNIFIPKQREYLVVTVKKESFEIDMELGKPMGISAFTASAPTSIVSAISSGDIFEIFRNITMKKMAIKLDYLPSATFFKFPLDYVLKPTLRYECVLPKYSEAINLSLLSLTEKGIDFIPTGFAVADETSLEGTITTPDGINSFNPYTNIISISSDTGAVHKKSSISIAFKRNIDASERVVFDDYLQYFSLIVEDNYNVLTNDFMEGEKTSIKQTKLVKYTTLPKDEVVTTLYWEIYSPHNERIIDLKTLSGVGVDIKEVIDGMKDNESLRFIQMYFALSQDMDIKTFDENLFLTNITHSSIAEEVLKYSNAN